MSVPHRSTSDHVDAVSGPHRSEAAAVVGLTLPSAIPDESRARSGPTKSEQPDELDETETLAAQVEQPAKVMRIGTMVKQLLEEVRAAPLDEAGRRRLAEIHALSIRELESGLAPELRAELGRLSLPFTPRTARSARSGDVGDVSADDYVPSEAELRIAQAQLVGWLEGLFHGIQTALFAQQLAARQQVEETHRRALPAGSGQQAVVVGPGGQVIGTGQYL